MLDFLSFVYNLVFVSILIYVFWTNHFESIQTSCWCLFIERNILILLSRVAFDLHRAINALTTTYKNTFVFTHDPDSIQRSLSLQVKIPSALKDVLTINWFICVVGGFHQHYHYAALIILVYNKVCSNCLIIETSSYFYHVRAFNFWRSCPL